jgi:hypothetical protein
MRPLILNCSYPQRTECSGIPFFFVGQQHLKSSKDSIFAEYLCPLSIDIRPWVTCLCIKIRRNEYSSVEVSTHVSHIEGSVLNLGSEIGQSEIFLSVFTVRKGSKYMSQLM